MLPPGLGLNAISAKALEASKAARLPRAYWDWEPMPARTRRGSFHMRAGALSGVEMGLASAGVPFTRGGVMAAVDFLTEK